MAPQATTEKYRGWITAVTEQIELALEKGEWKPIAVLSAAAGLGKSDLGNAKSALTLREPHSTLMRRFGEVLEELRLLDPRDYRPRPSGPPPDGLPERISAERESFAGAAFDPAPFEAAAEIPPPEAPPPAEAAADGRDAPDEYDDKLELYDDVQLLANEEQLDEETACARRGIDFDVYIACKRAVLAQEEKEAEERRIASKSAKTIDWEQSIERGMEKALAKVKEAVSEDGDEPPAAPRAPDELPEPLSAELAVHHQLIALLSPLPKEARGRVVTAAAIMLGLPGAFFYSKRQRPRAEGARGGWQPKRRESRRADGGDARQDP